MTCATIPGPPALARSCLSKSFLAGIAPGVCVQEGGAEGGVAEWLMRLNPHERKLLGTLSGPSSLPNHPVRHVGRPS